MAQNLFDSTDITKPVPMDLGAASREGKKQALRKQPQFRQQSPLLGGLREGLETVVDPVRAPFAGESKLMTDASGGFGGTDQWKRWAGQGNKVLGESITGALGSIQPTLDYIQHGNTPVPNQPVAPPMQPHEEPGEGVASGAGTGVPAKPSPGMGGALQPKQTFSDWRQPTGDLPPGTGRLTNQATGEVFYSGSPRTPGGVGGAGTASPSPYSPFFRTQPNPYAGPPPSGPAFFNNPRFQANLDAQVAGGRAHQAADWERQNILDQQGAANQAADYYLKMMQGQGAAAMLPGGAGFDLKRAEILGNVIGGYGFYSLTPQQQTQILQEYQRALMGGGTAPPAGGATSTTPTTQPGKGQAPAPTSSVPHSLMRGAARGAAGVGGYMGTSKLLGAIPGVSKALGAAGPWGKAAGIALPLAGGYLADWLGEKGLEQIDPGFVPQQPAYAAGMVGGGLGTVMGSKMMPKGSTPQPESQTPATVGGVGTVGGPTMPVPGVGMGYPRIAPGQKLLPYSTEQGTPGGGPIVTPPPGEPPVTPGPPFPTMGSGPWGGPFGEAKPGGPRTPASGTTPPGGEPSTKPATTPQSSALGTTGVQTVGTAGSENVQQQFYGDPQVDEAIRRWTGGLPTQASTAQATPTAPQVRPGQEGMAPAQNAPSPTIPVEGVSMQPPPPITPFTDQQAAAVRAWLAGGQAPKQEAWEASMQGLKSPKPTTGAVGTASKEPQIPPAALSKLQGKVKKTLGIPGAAGASAARAGKQLVDNPYVEGSPQASAWEAGWKREKGQP